MINTSFNPLLKAPAFGIKQNRLTREERQKVYRAPQNQDLRQQTRQALQDPEMGLYRAQDLAEVGVLEEIIVPAGVVMKDPWGKEYTIGAEQLRKMTPEDYPNCKIVRGLSREELSQRLETE